MITNPYKILGVPDGASVEECTKAYKKLAKKYHPDLNPNNKEAEKRMAEINAAYDQIKSGAAGSSQSSYGYGYRGNSSSSRSSSSSAPDYLNSVSQFIQTGQYQQAVNLLNTIENRDARWYYLSALANMSLGNVAIAQDHIRSAYAKEPNNTTYQRAYEQIINGVNPLEYNPFSSFFDFGNFNQSPPRQEYSQPEVKKNRGCLSRILRIIFIIIIIRLILTLVSNFAYNNSVRRYYEQYGYNQQYSQQQDNSDNYGEIFGEAEGQEGNL